MEINTQSQTNFDGADGSPMGPVAFNSSAVYGEMDRGVSVNHGNTKASLAIQANGFNAEESNLDLKEVTEDVIYNTQKDR